MQTDLDLKLITTYDTSKQANKSVSHLLEKISNMFSNQNKNINKGLLWFASYPTSRDVGSMKDQSDVQV